MALTIDEVNNLSYEEFTDIFSNVIEKSPGLAGTVWALQPFSSLDDLHAKMWEIVESLPQMVKEGLLRCVPDLAGRLAQAGALSAESTSEQKSAGLLDLTPEERDVIEKNNQMYKDKFKFPFVICARLNKKHTIIESMAKRLKNSNAEELSTAIGEVRKISYLRLCNIIQVNEE